MDFDKHIFDAVKTVFLDLDDTLWDFAANSRVALRRTYDHFGIARWQPDYQAFESCYETRNAELWHDYHHGRVTREFLLSERFRHVLAVIDCSADTLELGRLMNDWYLDTLATLPAIVPGARHLLEHLHRKGYGAHVLSNGFAGVQQRKLISGGINHLVDSLVLSDDCGITKPQRGIFDYALQRTGATADSALMVGDDPDTDIKGAHDAGWHTVFYNAKGREPLEGTADVVVDRLEQICDLLQGTE